MLALSAGVGHEMQCIVIGKQLLKERDRKWEHDVEGTPDAGCARGVFGTDGQERRMRQLAQHNLSECQDMVEASAKAIDEWVPMMTALRRHPGVLSPSQLCSESERPF